MIATIWKKGKKKDAGVGPAPLMILFSPAQQVFVSHLVGY
jgi:hypothetical protein